VPHIPAGLSVDNSGFNYLVCTATNNSIDVQKNDQNNFSAWIRTYNRTLTSIDGASGITLDNAGNIYVCGSTTTNIGDKDYWVLKCANSNGDTLWTREYDGGNNGDDEAVAITLTGSTSAPDVVVCGYTTNANGDKDIMFIK